MDHGILGRTKNDSLADFEGGYNFRRPSRPLLQVRPTNPSAVRRNSAAGSFTPKDDRGRNAINPGLMRLLSRKEFEPLPDALRPFLYCRRCRFLFGIGLHAGESPSASCIRNHNEDRFETFNRDKVGSLQCEIILILLQFVGKSVSFAHAFQTIPCPFFLCMESGSLDQMCIVSLVILQMQIKGKAPFSRKFGLHPVEALAGGVRCRNPCHFSQVWEKACMGLTEAEVAVAAQKRELSVCALAALELERLRTGTLPL